MFKNSLLYMNSQTALDELVALVRSGGITNLTPVLPFMLTLRGNPFSLKDHFIWEPLFSLDVPKNRTVKCGRQVGKSESSAAQLLAWAWMREYFNILYVSPRWEQTRTFSNDKVQPFISGSPIFQNRDLNLPNNVTHRVPREGNNLYFSYALLDRKSVV